MKAISSAPSMKLTGTSTTPSRAVANTVTAYCQELCASSASRSPLARPAGGERRGHPVHRGVELGVGDPALAGDDRQLAGVAAGGPAQQVTDRVLARPADRGRGVGPNMRRILAEAVRPATTSVPDPCRSRGPTGSQPARCEPDAAGTAPSSAARARSVRASSGLSAAVLATKVVRRALRRTAAPAAGRDLGGQRGRVGAAPLRLDVGEQRLEVGAQLDADGLAERLEVGDLLLQLLDVCAASSPPAGSRRPILRGGLLGRLDDRARGLPRLADHLLVLDARLARSPGG